METGPAATEGHIENIPNLQPDLVYNFSANRGVGINSELHFRLQYKMKQIV